MAQWQHPIMTVVHPWLAGAAWTLVGLSLLIAVWGLLSDESNALLLMLASMAGSAITASGAWVANPIIDADERFRAWCVLSMLVLGLCALWEYWNDWSYKPFQFLVWVAPTIALIRAAMTIPNLDKFFPR